VEATSKDGFAAQLIHDGVEFTHHIVADHSAIWRDAARRPSRRSGHTGSEAVAFSLAACLVPGRRATEIDAVEALRYESVGLGRVGRVRLPANWRLAMGSDRREFLKQAAAVAASVRQPGLSMPTPRASALMTKFGL